MKRERKNPQVDAFRKRVFTIFRKLKNEAKIAIFPIVPAYEDAKLLAYLRPVTRSVLEDPEEIRRLAIWRKMHEWWFPAQFEVTFAGTKKWAKEKLLDAKDRFLFVVETPTGKPIGHMGLFRFNFKEYACEVDNIVRGEKDSPGVMTLSLITLISWTRKVLGVRKFYLEVFSDNDRAIALYKRCGFAEFKRVPLKKVVEKNRISWIESHGEADGAVRYNVYMVLK